MKRENVIHKIELTEKSLRQWGDKIVSALLLASIGQSNVSPTDIKGEAAYVEADGSLTIEAELVGFCVIRLNVPIDGWKLLAKKPAIPKVVASSRLPVIVYN